MGRYGFIIGLVFLLGCEKDPVIPESLNSNLSEFMTLYLSDDSSRDVWTIVGNHPAFERESDEKPIHLICALPAKFSNVLLFISDSIQYPDSNELYRKSNRVLQPIDGNSKFGRFELKISNQNSGVFAKVAITNADSLYLSEPIFLRPNSEVTNTKNISDIVIETTAGGRAFINWTGAGINENWKNLVEISDQTGSVFCAVETTDMSFLFHNLRNVSQNFTPELRDPRLVEGQEYGLKLYRYDNLGWMRNYRQVKFVADSNIIQEFE